jgi:hypothetical protein
MIGERLPGQALGWPVRVLLLLAAAGLAGILALARNLEPDTRGFGTHTQLGLPPCAFHTVTGRLCPTCGMTTSFAWMARFRVDRSWRANPAGCLYALSSIPLMAWFVVSAVVDKPVGFQNVSAPLTGLLIGSVAVGFVFWLIRLIVSSNALVEPVENLVAVASVIGL